MHEEILDSLDDAIVRYRAVDRTIVYANRAFRRVAVPPGAVIVGRTLDDVVPPALLAAACQGEVVDAEGRTLSWTRQQVSTPEGIEVLAVGRDVTAHRAARAELAESEARFRELADRSADVVFRFELEPTPRFTYMSPSVEKIIGYRPEQLSDLDHFLQVIRHQDAAMIRDVVTGIAEMPDRYDLHFRRPDGEIVIAEVQVTLLRDGLLGVGRDVTEVRRLQDELAALALRDPLTGLANRRLLDEVLGLALARTDRAGTPLAVAVLDLDGFKAVNDAHGHDAGDEVLVETARRLSCAVRDADVVARIGGDEFVIVHEAVGTDAVGFTKRLAHGLSQPVELSDGTIVTCPASIGMVDTDAVGRDPQALLAAADAAMYEIKRQRNGRDPVHG